MQWQLNSRLGLQTLGQIGPAGTAKLSAKLSTKLELEFESQMGAKRSAKLNAKLSAKLSMLLGIRTLLEALRLAVWRSLEVFNLALNLAPVCVPIWRSVWVFALGIQLGAFFLFQSGTTSLAAPGQRCPLGARGAPT